MKIKNYFRFVKDYYNHTTQHQFPESSAPSSIHSVVPQKYRIVRIMVGYAFAIFCFSIVLFKIPNDSYYPLAIIGLFGLIICLYNCRFSFLYYLILYIIFSSLKDSINGKFIILSRMFYPNRSKDFKDIWKVITRRHNLYTITGNFFGLKIYLANKDKSKRKYSKKECNVLKITPNKMFWNGKEISSKKILSLSEFEECINNYVLSTD